MKPEGSPRHKNKARDASPVLARLAQAYDNGRSLQQVDGGVHHSH
jgi:hypothetical protein